MEYISYRKMYLLIAIIILLLSTINKKHIDKRFKTIIFNPILKIAVLSYLTYRSMFTMEFSLFTAVIIVFVLELVDDINYSNAEHFNTTTNNQNVNNVVPTPVTNNNAANVPTNNNQSNNTNNQQTSTTQSTTNQSVDKKSVDNQSTTNKSVDNKPTVNQPTVNQPVVNQPAPNQPKSNQPASLTANKVDASINKGPTSTLSALDSVGIIKSKTVTTNTVTSSTSKLSVAPSAINSTLGLPNNTTTTKQTLQTNIVTINSGTGVGSVPPSDDNYVLKDSTSSGNTNVTTKIKIICKPTIPTPKFSHKDDDKYVVRFVINTSILSNDGNCVSNTTPVNINMTEGNYRIKSLDTEEDYLRINHILIALNTEEKNITKGVNLLIKEGYKIIITSKTGQKVEFASTYDEDALFIQSDDIKKGLLNLNKIGK
jgi:hypothetical protein